MTATAWARRAGLALIVPAVAAGCGSSSGSNGATASGGSSSTRSIATAKAFVDQAINGADRPLPTSSPKSQPGKKVWVLSCSQAAEGCQVPAAGAAEAGKMIGWKMTVFDGKGDPATYAKGVRSAIAAKADGIILVSIDCAAIVTPSLLSLARLRAVMAYVFCSSGRSVATSACSAAGTVSPTQPVSVIGG